MYTQSHTDTLYRSLYQNPVCCIIQLKYGYEGYRQFPLPRAQVYFHRRSRGNKHGRRVMDTACIPK